MSPSPAPGLDPVTARVHAGEYAVLAAMEAGMAEGYDRARANVTDHRAPLFRSLDLAAVGARRRAGHYADLSRVLSAYADADPATRVGVLERLTLDLSDVHDGARVDDGGPRDAP